MKINQAHFSVVVCSALLFFLSACAPAGPAAPRSTDLASPVATVRPTTAAPPTATVEAPQPTATPSIAPTAVQPTLTELPPPQTPTLPAPVEGRYAVVGVAPDDVLQLRTAPGLAGAVIGRIPAYATDIEMTAPEEKVGDEQWAPVNYQGESGWVNAAFLAKQVGTPPAGLAETAAEAIHLLKQQNFIQLATLLSTEGLRFSPYAFVSPEDLNFNPLQVASLPKSQKVYHWGTFDGSGLPIDMNFKDYYKRFVFDVDFAQPDEIGFNASLGGGSAINNIAEFYPGAAVVEYHFPGFDPNFGGLDWRSLRLVFAPDDQKWALIAIVHDEWGP